MTKHFKLANHEDACVDNKPNTGNMQLLHWVTDPSIMQYFDVGYCHTEYRDSDSNKSLYLVFNDVITTYEVDPLYRGVPIIVNFTLLSDPNSGTTLHELIEAYHLHSLLINIGQIKDKYGK